MFSLLNLSRNKESKTQNCLKAYAEAIQTIVLLLK